MDRMSENHSERPEEMGSAQVSFGHSERAAADKTDPVARREAEKAEQQKKMDEAISQGETVRDKVINALKEVYDPEIPVNIYELGLIYDVQVDEQNAVQIVMTLTSPACPVAQELPLEARRAAERVPEVSSAGVELTFDPPWSQEMMSEEARLHLGLF